MDTDIYTQVKASVKQSLKIDLENYKDEQMKRRLDSWLVRSRAGTWNEYFDLVARDNNELERFRNYLTINVTEFFRDPPRWNTLRNEILPYLQKHAEEHHQVDGLKFWSAGCSIGAEPYSLAIMMAEAASTAEVFFAGNRPGSRRAIQGKMRAALILRKMFITWMRYNDRDISHLLHRIS